MPYTEAVVVCVKVSANNGFTDPRNVKRCNTKTCRQAIFVPDADLVYREEQLTRRVLVKFRCTDCETKVRATTVELQHSRRSAYPRAAPSVNP